MRVGPGTQRSKVDMSPFNYGYSIWMETYEEAK